MYRLLSFKTSEFVVALLS